MEQIFSLLLAIIQMFLCLFLGHNYMPATCTEPETCSVCGVTQGEALGHDFYNGYCQRCGQGDDNNNSDVPNGNNLTLQDYKDYCIDYGTYSDKQYGITYYHSGLSTSFSMVYNPAEDRLRFESLNYDGEDTRFLVLWIDPGVSQYKWQFQWKDSSVYLAGEGTLEKNKSLYMYDEYSCPAHLSWMQELNHGYTGFDDIFLSAAITDMSILDSCMELYFEENNTGLTMDFFEIGD